MALMLFRWLGVPLAVAAVGTALTGCASAGASADAGRPSVAASFYPLAFVAERVGGAEVQVENLTTPGVEPHDLELTTSQVRELASADLVIYEKDFQPAVDEAVEQNASALVLEVTDIVSVERGDPHVWLDPTRLAAITDAVADALAEVAPKHADRFHQRADSLVAELDTLDQDFRDGLTDCARTVVVTSHDAFGYLADRYGLEMVGISGLAPDAEPSPARLKKIHQVIEDADVTTVFYERLVSPDVAQTLSTDLGVSTAVLDPVEGLTGDTETEDYLTLMRANLEALKEANGCR
jgi:zinc transport system substrate-binding protein